MAEHQHNHSHGANKKILLISFVIIFSFMIVEAIGGFLTNSLALLSDAGHMLSDAVSLAIALLAFIVSEKAVTMSKTYGYKRIEILAATLNGVTLIAIALYIFYEAIDRFQNPPEVATTGMLIISVIGLLVNILVAWIMLKGGDTEENLNMRGAFLHVISDMLGSVGAIIAALLMMFFGFGWADPLASVIVAVLVLRGGYSVTKNSLHVLMEGTPTGVDSDQVVNILNGHEQVRGVHDVHIWTVTSGFHALTCHIVLDDELTVKQSSAILAQIEHELLHANIQHATIQIEGSAHNHYDSIYCTVKAEISGHHHHHH
ncbi:cation diffusion facilitator family transporter [Solibacillus sp. MA9]|uniref:Cation diffusion facilitator family transporter n=1 Tax=Solibacillus palustris TaxID=2908203 RepID=A0ABS9UCS0_9BACL|nr:cation diffusion facilitator family transporter [Solibacillus sp. MA9]MCH7321930.1 cation diffusion facilitator family transporter [Solibacillus sp. MA9]